MRTIWLCVCFALLAGCRSKDDGQSASGEVEPMVERTLAFSLEADTTTAGAPIPYGLTWVDRDGLVTADPVDTYTVSSDIEDPLAVDDFTLTATAVGDHTLTATAREPNGTQQSATASLLVDPGPAASVVIELSAAEVEAGTTVTFVLTAVDNYGNDVDTDAATVTSDEAVTIADDGLTTTEAGEYTVTATLDEAQDNATWTVKPGPAAAIDLVLTETVLEIGDETGFTVTVTDTHGNQTDDPTTVGVDEEGATVTEDTIEFETDGVFNCWAEVTETEIIDVETVVIDSSGPDLTVFTPERGTWTTESEVEVSGHAEDTSGLDFVTINGEEAKGIIDGDFAEDVFLEFGVNIIQTVASDLDWDEEGVGNQSSDVRAVLQSEVFWDPATPIDGGLLLRMWEGEGGLGQLESLATTLMDSLDLDSLLGDPIFEEEFCITILWWELCYDLIVYVDEITYESVSMSIDPTEAGTIDARLTLTDVLLSLRTEGYVEGTGTVTATAVHVDMSFVPVVSDLGYLEIADFVVDVPTPEGFAVELEEDLVDAADLLDIDAAELLEEQLAILLEGAAADAVPDMLGDVLSVLAFDEVFYLSDNTYTLSSRIQEVEVDEYGVSMRARTQVEVDEVLGAGTEGAPSGFPYFGYTIPTEEPTGSGTEFSLSTDMLNQLLFAFWQGGLFDKELSEEDLGLDMDAISILLPGLDAITMITTPLLPPVVTPRTDWDAGHEYDFQLGDTLVQIYNGEVTGESLAIELYISAVAPLSLSTEEGDWTISMELSDPVVYADEIYTDPSLGFSSRVVEPLFVTLMASYLPELTGALGTLPLPEFEGLSFVDISTGLEGPDEPPGYWVLSGSLD